MKIAMVSERIREVAELADALRRRGNEVTVQVPEEPGSLPHLGDLTAALQAGWQRNPPELVHTHFWTSGLAGVLASRRLGVPVVHSCRGLGVAAAPGERSSDRLDVERLLTREVAHVVASCQSEAFHLTTIGAKRSKISVVPSGVDLDVFTPDGPQAPRVLAHRVVAVGELLPHSGFGEIITALSTVEETELVIVCDGRRANGDGGREARRLRALARRHEVSGRVRLVERTARSSTASLLRSADVVLDVPWHDRSSVAVLEAMACGVPVITTPVGGLVDTVVDGVTGRHVPSRSPAALARALRAMLASHTERYEFGTAARDRVSVRYTWDRVAAELLRVYEKAGASTAAQSGPAVS